MEEVIKDMPKTLIIACLLQGGMPSRANPHCEIFDCKEVRTTVHPHSNKTGWHEAKVGPLVGIPIRSGRNFTFLVSHPQTAPVLPPAYSKYVVMAVPHNCTLARDRLHWRWLAVNPDDLKYFQ